MKTPEQILEHSEPHSKESGEKLNRLRAAVLGANDGIVSTASLIVGVAGASNTTSFILTAGIAGLVAGALSMGVGEYVSVSAQRDTEKALIEKEKKELKDNSDFELEELYKIYVSKGLSEETARMVARELTEHDSVTAHLNAELGIDPNALVDPWHAAFASSAAFVCGAIIPIAMVILSPVEIRIPATFFGVLLALITTGMLSAHFGGARKIRAAVRVVFGGILAMIVTFAIGKLFGIAGI
ncbi:MAG: VIT family protein [Candidatus Falkowbacteria bacterium]|nr:VIT family protein [Candidatus Falkowbacteria bacterium]